MLIAGGLTVLGSHAAPAAVETAPEVKEAPKETTLPAPVPAKEVKPPGEPVKATTEKPADPAVGIDPDDEAAAENLEAQKAAVAKPVTADLVQVYGWREHIFIKGVVEKTQAKLDTGALTSSIHAEEKELFERDGKKWVRFIVTDPSLKKPVRTRIEAPLVRIARIKEPGGQSTPREVVRLSFTIGDRKCGGEFTLNNRSNMLAPVLIGRNMIKVLGWVDPSRTYLAEQKIFR
ncbi:MAG: RimK/LysX family protein [Luteolibacter sp.]|uniref:ATP-dependent zinc protease family protein n=1 Tax=Luteolibacter sp. TaxID=1962973 RepID=UPI003263892C